MNPFFLDPNEVRLPPEAVRLTKVQVMPQPNGRQVKIHLELTPFMKRPNIEVTVISSVGKEVGHASILETMLHTLEITLHLRQVEPGEALRLETRVYYQRLPEPSDTPVEIPLPDPIIVDRNTTNFNLPQVEK